MKTLTLILVVDAEKPVALLRYCMYGLRALNGDALTDVQVVAIVQGTERKEIVDVLSAQPFPVLVAGKDAYVGDACLWDIFDFDAAIITA